MHFHFTGLFGAWTNGHRALLQWSLVAALTALAGCGKNVAQEASDSDANGYLCSKCGAKLYTDRSVFLASTCPKCQQEGLVEVVGHFCPKDNHLIVMGRSRDGNGVTACETCGTALGGMRLPREKDLKAWGATRVPK